MRQGITIDKKMMRQRITWKDIVKVWQNFYATEYTFGPFYATGHKVSRDLPHTSVTSLVKSPSPGDQKGFNDDTIFVSYT